MVQMASSRSNKSILLEQILKGSSCLAAATFIKKSVGSCEISATMPWYSSRGRYTVVRSFFFVPGLGHYDDGDDHRKMKSRFEVELV